MFHQANLNYATAGTTTINGVTSKLSMFQVWVETVIQEMIRIQVVQSRFPCVRMLADYRSVTWPILSLKHDDVSTY